MMDWPTVALLLGILAAGVTAFGLWLRQRPLAQLQTLTHLAGRVDKVEAQLANGAGNARVTPMPMGQGLYGRPR